MNHEIMDRRHQETHGGIDRRCFFERMGQMVGGTTATFALLPLLGSVNPQAPTVPNGQDLFWGPLDYDAEGVKISGYRARPKAAGKRPAVIVIHENRGLNPHIEDVTRRVALEGFFALAPDMLSPLGGTPADETQATKLIGSLKLEETVARLAAAVKFLATHAETTGKVGVVGFCWGGGMVNSLAAAGTTLNAGVAYYGRQIPAADVPKITAPLLLHYAGNDQRINAGIADFEGALKANKKVYELYVYEGAEHAFNNNTNAARYNKAAAELAWSRTIGWFKKYLS